MSTDWKPGTVALLDIGTGTGIIAIRTSYDGGNFVDQGVWQGGPQGQVFEDAVQSARPLVVIDPEDREQVERLIGLLEAKRFSSWACGAVSCLQTALREFANPTPPSEPTDPTARVTDRRDNIWRLLADGEWVCTSGPDIGEYLVWSRLAAERGPLTVAVTA